MLTVQPFDGGRYRTEAESKSTGSAYVLLHICTIFKPFSLLITVIYLNTVNIFIKHTGSLHLK